MVISSGGLEEKSADSAPSKPSWSPSNAELEEGVVFINAHAPECDAQNEQTLWILINIKADSGTPIASWPEPKVRLMCQNKSRGQAGAVSMTEFPLTTYSLKPFLNSVLLPFLYPLMLNFGMLLLGCPGVGKTPFVVILAMALGRYHVRRSGDATLKPGWRRAKSLDNFRHRAPRVEEALFLDDPSRAKVSMADLKSFLTVDEDGTVGSRYNDTRLIRNQLRAYASNDLKDDLEGEQKIGTTLLPGRFLAMLDDLFAGEKEKDVLAVLKRAIIFVFTGTALYLRLPSEDKESIVHRICVDDLHKDLLADKDKPFYGKYKAGSMETGPSFDTDVGQEQRMLEQAISAMAEYEKVQDYIAFVDKRISGADLFSPDLINALRTVCPDRQHVRRLWYVKHGSNGLAALHKLHLSIIRSAEMMSCIFICRGVQQSSLRVHLIAGAFPQGSSLGLSSLSQFFQLLRCMRRCFFPHTAGWVDKWTKTTARTMSPNGRHRNSS